MPSQDGAAESRWKPKSGLALAGGRLLDFIFPPQALDEGRSGPAFTQTVGLSAETWTRITFLETPVCDGCGAAFEFDQGLGALCAACSARRRQFGRARAACVYDEVSRDLILKLKHADRTELARLLALWIHRAAADLIAEADAIVPVPLHRWRLFQRRYNQAAEIARPLAVMTGLPFLPDSLQRLRDTGSQAGKSGGARRRNVAAAFGVPKSRRPDVAGKRILLIDDVMTTGATAEGCARALKRAGAAAVDVAVVARVKDRQIGPI